MGSINKTDNFGLPQFGDDDKPTWRGDVNDAMSKIDKYLTKVTAVITPLDGLNGDGLNDDYAIIQAALDTGANVIVAPVNPLDSTNETVIKFSETFVLVSEGQKFETMPGVVLCPAFVGDSVQITDNYQHVKVSLRHDLQPVLGDYSDAYGIRVGSAIDAVPAYYPFNPSIAGSKIIGTEANKWKGGGVRIENGPMTDCQGAYISDITGDAFNCGGTHLDANHIRFDNTHVIRAERGYVLNFGPPGSPEAGTLYSSRHCIFSNAKAFDCQQNFFIDSAGSSGTIFSEWWFDHVEEATNDRFGPNSTGNKIEFIGTITTYGRVEDDGKRNVIGGYDYFNSWDYLRWQAKSLQIQNNIESYWDFKQVSPGRFKETVSDTLLPVHIYHDNDGPGLRTDHFDDNQLAMPSPADATGATMMLNYLIHSYTIPALTAPIAAGASQSFDVGLDTAGSAWFGSCSVGGADIDPHLQATVIFHDESFTSINITNTSTTDALNVSGLVVNILYQFLYRSTD